MNLVRCMANKHNIFEYKYDYVTVLNKNKKIIGCFYPKYYRLKKEQMEKLLDLDLKSIKSSYFRSI